MAYSRAVMERARLLYADGKNFEQISDALARPFDKGGFGKVISGQTISRWKQQGQPKTQGVPKDWEAFREEIETSTAAAARRDLGEQRKRLAKMHYDDLDALRTQIHDAQFRRDQKTGKMVPKKLTPSGCNLLASALSKVLIGQRTIFGQSAYNVGAGDGGPTLPGVWLPPEDEDAEPEK